MKKKLAGALIICAMCLLLPFSAKAKTKEADVKDALYTDGFEKVSGYEKYANEDASVKDSLVWIEGRGISYNEKAKSIIIRTVNGEWAAYCGESGTSSFYALAAQAVDKDLRVFGKYTGTSQNLGIPEVSFINSDIYAGFYRMESTDNSYRLSFCDYAVEKNALDSEYTYGEATFKTSSAFKTEESTDTLYIYYSDKIPAFLLAHTDDLTDSAFDKISDDELLETFADVYLESSEKLISRKEVQIGGRKGLICESTFTVEDVSCPMNLYSYMTVIDRRFYYFGNTEPYLSTETFKNILMEVVSDITIKGDSNSVSGAVNKIPTKEDLVGDYLMTYETVTASGETNTNTADNKMTMADLEDYDESTGVYAYSGDGFAIVLTFEFDQKGKVVCHGTVTYDDAVSSILGKKKD